MDPIKTPFNSGGVPAFSALKLMGLEDKPHTQGATATQYRQNPTKFTESQIAYIVQNFTNVSFNRSQMTLVLTKNPDFWEGNKIVAQWPSLFCADELGDYCWINGRGFMMIAEVEFKIANTVFWKMTGRDMATLATLFADYAHIEEETGICKTTDALRLLSKKPMITYTPLIGMANQKFTQNAFPCAAVLFTNLNLVLTAPNMMELIVPFGTATSMLTNVLDGETKNPINVSSVPILLYSKYVHVGPRQRLATIKNHNEGYFKEYLCAGEKSYPASLTAHNDTFELNLTGPVTFVLIYAQSKKDIADKKPFKFCKDNGEDYIVYAALNQNNQPREDGLPFAYNRGGKALEVFKHIPERHIYVLASFTEDETQAGLRGYQNWTNVDKKSVSIHLAPHDCELEIRVLYSSVNGWNTDEGIPGKLWESY